MVSPKRKAANEIRRKEDAGLRRMFNILSSKSHSKRKWYIDYECFKRISAQPCFYCGKPPSQKAYAQTRSSRKESFKQDYNRFVLYNGLDRIDNEIDYIETNLVPCCKICNFAKRDLSLDEFRGWAKNLYLRFFPSP